MNPTAPERNEADLLRRIGQGDREAFSELYDACSGVLYSVITRILNDPQEAQDVLQETFVQVWRRAGDFDPELGKPFNWVLTMARHKAIDRLRSSQRRTRLVEAAEAAGDALYSRPEGGDDRAQLNDAAQAVRQAMASLPIEQRHAIELAFFACKTQQEIAQALDEPLGTVKARIRRGMLKLRGALEPFSTTD